MPNPDLIYPPRIPGVQDKQLIQTVRAAGFPKFNKQLMSQARKPELYGISLQPAASDAISTEYAAPPSDAPESRRTRVKDGHRFTRRAECRLPDATADKLQLYVNADPKYRTVSDLVFALLMEYIKRKDQAYADRPAVSEK